MAVDTDESTGADSSRSPRRSSGAFDSIRSSFALQLAMAGLLFIAVGFVLGSGVWAGMLPIWGFALVAVGLGAYAVTHFSQRGSKG